MKKALTKLTLLFLLWRSFLFIVAFFSPTFIPEFGATFPYYKERLVSSNLPHFVWSFGNFDGVHYLGIAKNAYAFQFTQAFFPLYPILIKIGSYATGGSFLVSALLVSNISFFLALVFFYRLIVKTHGEKIAWWSSVFLVIFPTSFYFGSAYTESLFLLFVILAFYFLEGKKLILASVFGSFASATRLVGLFLAPSLVTKRNKKALIPLLIVPTGLVSYMVYLAVKFNQPLYFLTSQNVFGQERETGSIILLPQVFWRYLKILSTTSGSLQINAAFELAATILAITLLALSFKIVKVKWVIFSFLAILTPTLTGTFASMPRYVLIAFPMYIVLASIKSSKVKLLIVAAFTFALAITTAFFAQGYWVA